MIFGLLFPAVFFTGYFFCKKSTNGNGIARTSGYSMNIKQIRIGTSIIILIPILIIL